MKNYQNEGHFKALRELYEKDELTSAINRIVEDINHRFMDIRKESEKRQKTSY